MSVYTSLNLTIQPGESGFERALEFLRDRFCAESERPSGSVEADGAVIELTTEDAIKYVVGDDDCGAGMEELKALLLQLEQISPGLQCQGKWNVTFATSGGSDEWSFKWKTGEFRNVINESEEQLMEGLDEMSRVKAKAPGLMEEILEDECMTEFIFVEGNDLNEVLNSLIEEGNDGDERSQDLARRLADALGVDISWAVDDWRDG